MAQQEDITVVILGGCGFLGQHVVAEFLNEKETMTKQTEEERGDSKQPFIKDIKVLDVKPLAKDSLTGQREDGKAVNYQVCDIRDFEDLTKKLKGASAVINCAVVTPDFLKEDLGCGEHMHQVNVEGTRNVVRACQALGIQGLVHTSSVSVKMGGKRIIEHSETLTPHVSEDELVLGDYARGRLKAENIVLEANGSKSGNGLQLNTIVLRPPLIYGEGDTNFVPVIYRLAKANGDRIPSIGNPEAVLQAAYGGNVAVAHVCALKHLLSTDDKRTPLELCHGLPVYVTDDSPPNNLPDLTSLFVSHAGFEPSPKDSYWSTSFYLYWAHFAATAKSLIGLSSAGGKDQQRPLLSWSLHRLASNVTVVSRMRAELCLGYSPVYSWEEALKRSNIYYQRQLD